MRRDRGGRAAHYYFFDGAPGSAEGIAPRTAPRTTPRPSCGPATLQTLRPRVYLSALPQFMFQFVPWRPAPQAQCGQLSLGEPSMGSVSPSADQ